MIELPSEEWSAYRARIRDEFAARWITRGQRDTLIAIADLNLAGDWSPTVAKIAVYANVSRRTVQRTRGIAKERGILTVRPRFPDGWQATNHYEPVLPTTPVTPKPAVIKGRQTGLPSSKKEGRKRLNEGIFAAADVRKARADLAAIAQRRTQALGLSPS